MTIMTPAIITCSAHYQSRFEQAWQRLNPGGDEPCPDSIFWFHSVYAATAKLIQLIKTASRVIWVVELDNLDHRDMQVFNSLALLNEATVIGVLVHPFAETKKRLALASGCPQVVDIAGMTRTVELIRRDAIKAENIQPDPTLIVPNSEESSTASAASSPCSATTLTTKPVSPVSWSQKQEQQDPDDETTFSPQESQDPIPAPQSRPQQHSKSTPPSLRQHPQAAQSDQPSQTQQTTFESKIKTEKPEKDPAAKPPPDGNKPTSVTLSREELDTLLGD